MGLVCSVGAGISQGGGVDFVPYLVDGWWGEVASMRGGGVS